MKWPFLIIIFIILSINSLAQGDKPTSQIPATQNIEESKNTVDKFAGQWGRSYSLSMENYYTSKIQGSNEVANLMFIRGIATAGRHGIRASLPILSTPTPNHYISGIGNINVLDEIRITGDSSRTHFGLGPLISIPTASRRALGVNYWQFGITSLAVYGNKSGFIIGGFLTFRNSIHNFLDKGGVISFQPIFVVHLGHGFYGRSLGATLVFDFNTKKTIVPLGIGIGKFFKIGNALGNIFIEPGYTVYSKGDRLPAQELLIGMNFIWFRNKKTKEN